MCAPPATLPTVKTDAQLTQLRRASPRSVAEMGRLHTDVGRDSKFALDALGMLLLTSAREQENSEQHDAQQRDDH